MNLQELKKTLNNNWEMIFQKLDIDYEQLGDNVYSTCPVHDNSDNKRAFSYCTKKGIWKCWTRDCQHDHNNDIYGLIKGTLSKKEGIDLEFKDVLKWCKSTLNIHNVSHQKKIEKKEDEFEHIIDSFKRKISQKTFEKIELEDSSIPSKYFLGRGFKSSTLKFFEIGDCVNNKSKMYDRAIIPIYDDAGKSVIGLIGRAVKEYKTPKFLISKGFDKRYCLYNYHNAISKTLETSCLFICEGQGDVWKLYESGVLNAVSIFGKVVSKEQEDKILKLPITTLVVLTDNDQAGREAKTQIQRQFSRTHRLIFPQLKSKDIGDMSIVHIKKDILSNIEGLY
jgi:5S rRNA maturation endonuclease (ribonuclease M5)